jgi:menaquinol-cytochrome c reductase iron-sulfur subunit
MRQTLTRRDFSERLAFGSFWTAVATSVLGMLKLPKPAVMPEVSSRLKLGAPGDFPPGSVRAFTEKNVLLFSDVDGVWAVSTVCTHLGCIVDRTPNGQFECPCHGSRFDGTGRPTAGPAPRGLEWLEVRQAPNGLLYADVSRTVPGGTKWRIG